MSNRVLGHVAGVDGVTGKTIRSNTSPRLGLVTTRHRDNPDTLSLLTETAMQALVRGAA